jgi:hypothetical protein
MNSPKVALKQIGVSGLLFVPCCSKRVDGKLRAFVASCSLPQGAHFSQHQNQPFTTWLLWPNRAAAIGSDALTPPFVCRVEDRLQASLSMTMMVI